MRILLLPCSLYLICRISNWVTPEPCTFSPHTDGCGNHGWMWQCGHRNLSVIPNGQHIPPEYKRTSLTLDLSENSFTAISRKTFNTIGQFLRSRIASLSLRGNPIQSIGNFSFKALWNLCELDLSSCRLHTESFEINSLANLNKLKILCLHSNSFQARGYPDVAISKARTIENLTIDVFDGFQFGSSFQNLTNMKLLKFITGNSMFHLTNSTFMGLIKSPITNLELKFRNMIHCDVSEDIFCSFPFLRGVHIAFRGMCDLNVALNSLKCLQNRTMDHIIVNDNKPMIVTKQVFLNNENCKYLFNICSKRVELNGNRIAGISDNPLNTVMGQCVEYFDISSNRIEWINPQIVVDFLTRYPNLQVINISSNNELCNCETSWHNPYSQVVASRMTDNNETNEFSSDVFVVNEFFSNISSKVLFIKRGVITIKISEIITVLQLSKMYLHIFTALPRYNLILTINAKNLKELYMVHSNFSCQSLAPIQAPSLEIIDISNNDCSIIGANIFNFTLKLRVFLASNSNLRFASSLRYGTFFHNLTELQKVDVSRNSITYLPPAMFEDQQNSLLTVNLDSNLFSTIPVSNLKNLTHLYLRQNKISFFTKNDIERVMSMEKAVVFIEGNPISCECTHIWSLKWMKENQDRFVDLNKTLCINTNVLLSTFVNQEVFEKFEMMCQSDAWLIGSIFAFVFVIVVLLTSAAIKQYRVHVDYVILRMRSRWKGVIHVANSDDFPFDAFVSYTEEDYPACIPFYQALTSLGFKISIPDKDFLPGISEAEQLLKCMDQSRKVVIIVTENFLENGWNSYAVQMVVTHAFHNQRERSIIVIIKDDIPIERLPRDLKYIWWTIVSIRWPDGNENMDLFWEEIAAALRTN
nr:toll-like receptor 4 [Crassostrea gigas]